MPFNLDEYSYAFPGADECLTSAEAQLRTARRRVQLVAVLLLPRARPMWLACRSDVSFSMKHAGWLETMPFTPLAHTHEVEKGPGEPNLGITSDCFKCAKTGVGPVRRLTNRLRNR